ncbi:MAG: diguanylate cyclase [Deltaproteobacteria bacterium]|nr:diguanylate cyclase [Deltaproteobacteria bacterium]
MAENLGVSAGEGAVRTSPKILVVDDDASLREFAVETLATLGYTIETAADGVQAIEKVRADPPDVIILDVMMPKMNGLEVCRVVKSFAVESFIPIILVTVKADIESKVTGLKIGADDYLTKPYNPLELRARVASMLRIKAIQDKLNAKRRELESLSITDDLTGLHNHRAMQQRLKDEFLRAQRYNDPLSLLMVDIDHFKQVNDQNGHLFGDFVLAEISRVLCKAVRETDFVARYGGEEFLVILPQTHFAGSLPVAERLWRSVAAHPFADAKVSVSLTVSVGVSFFPNKNVATAEDLLASSDQALYQAKREGRNRICISQHVSYLYRPEATAH